MLVPHPANSEQSPNIDPRIFFGVLYIVVVVKPYCGGTNLEVLDVTFLLAVCLSQSAWQNSGKKKQKRAC